MEKTFSAPVSKLYQAWTGEDQLREWWHPMGNNLVRCTNEIREGGKVEYHFETAEGEPAFVISGTYKVAKPEEELVYTWNWMLHSQAVEDSSFVLNIRFESAGEGSKLLVKQENFQSEESVQPHREGWEKSLNDLERFLA